MEIDELRNKVNDTQVARLLDNIPDSVLALKARLRDSNMDSNSIGGTLFPPLSPYNIPMDTRPCTKALKADQLKGELRGDLTAYEKSGLFQRSVNQNTAYRGALLRYQLFPGENPPRRQPNMSHGKQSSVGLNSLQPSLMTSLFCDS